MDDLVDAEQNIEVEDEHEEGFTGCESAVCEGSVPSTEGTISAVMVLDAGRQSPRLEGCVRHIPGMEPVPRRVYSAARRGR